MRNYTRAEFTIVQEDVVAGSSVAAGITNVCEFTKSGWIQVILTTEYWRG